MKPCLAVRRFGKEDAPAGEQARYIRQRSAATMTPTAAQAAIRSSGGVGIGPLRRFCGPNSETAAWSSHPRPERQILMPNIDRFRSSAVPAIGVSRRLSERVTGETCVLSPPPDCEGNGKARPAIGTTAGSAAAAIGEPARQP